MKTNKTTLKLVKIPVNSGLSRFVGPLASQKRAMSTGKPVKGKKWYSLILRFLARVSSGARSESKKLVDMANWYAAHAKVVEKFGELLDPLVEHCADFMDALRKFRRIFKFGDFVGSVYIKISSLITRAAGWFFPKLARPFFWVYAKLERFFRRLRGMRKALIVYLRARRKAIRDRITFYLECLSFGSVPRGPGAFFDYDSEGAIRHIFGYLGVGWALVLLAFPL